MLLPKSVNGEPFPDFLVLSPVLSAAVNGHTHHRAIVTEKVSEKNVQIIMCKSRHNEPLDLCLWERTSPDEPSELIMVDSGTVQAANDTCPGGFLCADGSQLGAGKCGLTIRSGSGQIHYWTCTLVTDQGRVYSATNKVKGEPCFKSSCSICKEILVKT